MPHTNTTIVHSFDRAIFEIRECGEVAIQSNRLLDMIKDNLRERDIPFVTWEIDKNTTGIMQTDPDEEVI